MIEYVGIPFVNKGRNRSGCDCWGLVRLIYKEKFNTDLPDYLDYETALDSVAIEPEITKVKNQEWIKIDRPKFGDVVLLNVTGLPVHVGIVLLDKTMIHCITGAGTVIEKYNSLKWKDRIDGFYRHSSLC